MPWYGAKCRHGKESLANSHPPFGPCPGLLGQGLFVSGIVLVLGLFCVGSDCPRKGRYKFNIRAFLKDFVKTKFNTKFNSAGCKVHMLNFETDVFLGFNVNVELVTAFPGDTSFPQIFSPNSWNFLSASAFPLASSTGLCVCAVTRYFFHSVAL